MFTGIVEELGEVLALEPLTDSVRLTIAGPAVTADAAHGDSIAVNGVCLTVVDEEVRGGRFTADVMAETLERSNLGQLQVGSRVNLERPMVLGGRLDGHLVQGHVDATGTIVERIPGERWEVVRIALPADVARYVVEKGSITVDGISLTVVEVNDGDGAGVQHPQPAAEEAAAGSAAASPWFSVSLIPTTLELTTLGHKRVGDTVNLEVDVVAKYVERLTGAGKETHRG